MLWSPRQGLLLLGANDRTAACLATLLSAGIAVRAVGLDRPNPALEAAARAAGVPVLDAARPRDPATRERLAAAKAPLWVMAGYGRILPPEALAAAPAGVLNLHAGRLPEYRGASVLNWQILRGETEVGLSILMTDAGVDTGDVLAADTLPVGPDEDYGSVSARVQARFPALLLEVLDRVATGRLAPVPQDPAAGARWPKRRPGDGCIDWAGSTARQVHDLVRALAHPCPGAFTFLGEGTVRVWQSRVVAEGGEAGPPGTVIQAGPGGEARVAAAAGIVALRRWEGPGDGVLRPGDRLGTPATAGGPPSTGEPCTS